MGVKFKSDVDGSISGIRFYKGSQNTGTHTVSLWRTNGTLLARAVSTGETASGWQQVNFGPVNITANTAYVASYHTTSGRYSFNGQYFASQYDNAPLHALADAPSGGNGVWQTNSTPIFPAQNYLAGNFWVDVVFSGVTTSGPPTIPPSPTKSCRDMQQRDAGDSDLVLSSNSDFVLPAGQRSKQSDSTSIRLTISTL